MRKIRAIFSHLCQRYSDGQFRFVCQNISNPQPVACVPLTARLREHLRSSIYRERERGDRVYLKSILHSELSFITPKAAFERVGNVYRRECCHSFSPAAKAFSLGGGDAAKVNGCIFTHIPRQISFNTFILSCSEDTVVSSIYHH